MEISKKSHNNINDDGTKFIQRHNAVMRLQRRLKSKGKGNPGQVKKIDYIPPPEMRYHCASTTLDKEKKRLKTGDFRRFHKPVGDGADVTFRVFSTARKHRPEKLDRRWLKKAYDG